MSQFNHDVVVPPTVDSLTSEFKIGLDLIVAGYNNIRKGLVTLTRAFGKESYFYALLNDVRLGGGESPYDIKSFATDVDGLKKGFTQKAWMRVLDILKIQQAVSSKRYEEIMSAIRSKDVEDFTIENIAEMLALFVENSDKFVKEIYLEAFDVLRPYRKINVRDHKTNQKYGQFDVGMDCQNCSR